MNTPSPFARILFAASAVVVFSHHSSAVAGTLLTGGTKSAEEPNNYYGRGVRGYDFISNEPLLVTSLGFWDHAADGLTEDFVVALYDTHFNSTAIAWAIITSSSVIDMSVTVAGGNWRYEAMTNPIFVSPGRTYTLAFLHTNPISADDSLIIDPSSAVTSAGLALTRDSDRHVQMGNPWMMFPYGSGFGSRLYGMANAQFIPIPEPSASFLVTVSALGILLRRRSRKSGAV